MSRFPTSRSGTITLRPREFTGEGLAFRGEGLEFRVGGLGLISLLDPPKVLLSFV